MATEADFQSAQQRVQALTQRPSNTDLLDLYALFKQATTGDVQGSRPGIFDIKGRAKYDAWAGVRGVSREDARARYVSIVDRLARG